MSAEYLLKSSLSKFMQIYHINFWDRTSYTDGEFDGLTQQLS